LNVPSYWLELAEGLVLLVAVVLDQLRHSRQRSARYRPTDLGAVLGEEPVG
jgi:hypothetical protein